MDSECIFIAILFHFGLLCFGHVFGFRCPRRDHMIYSLIRDPNLSTSCSHLHKFSPSAIHLPFFYKGFLHSPFNSLLSLISRAIAPHFEVNFLVCDLLVTFASSCASVSFPSTRMSDCDS